MFGFKDISIEFLTGTPWAVGIALLVLVAAGIYLYLRTNPPLTTGWRILLGALRILAILALFAALSEPVISYTREYERPRKVAVLLDNSASMSKIESDKSRQARTDSLLSSSAYSRFQSAVNITPYYFGGNLAVAADKVDREKTALGDAVSQLERLELAQPSDYWLLLSDGKSNSGRDPRKAVMGLPTPIIAVDMASAAGGFDVGIGDINYNPVMFAGQTSELKITLNWHNARDKNIAVELTDSNRVVAQTTFAITQDEGIGEITLKYTPAEPGQRILKVNLPPLADEISPDNNHRSFSVTVLKSRLLVLLVSDQPDYELGFLKRFLSSSDKYEVELIVTGGRSGNLSGAFPDRQTELNRYDLIILHDPDPQRLAGKESLIKSYLSDRGGAIWLLMGRQFGRQGSVDWFNRLLPFYQSVPRAIEYFGYHAEPSEGNLFHPAVRLADNQTAIRKVWSELPPFEALVRCDKLDPQAVVLAYLASAGGPDLRIPVLGYKRYGPGKLLASAAQPFWKWGFVSLGFGEDDSHYGKFVEGVVSWLTVSDEMDPIRIKPQREIFHRGEVIRFDGMAFDLGFRPIPEVTGTVAITDQSGTNKYETDLIAQEDGNYRAEFLNVIPGEYTYLGKFEKDGQLLRQSTGKIMVETFSLEEYDQSGDAAELMAVSRLSGGSYFGFRDFDEALQAIDLAPVQVNQKGEIILFNKLWLLIIFIAAISTEWLLRKIHQLI